jgi:hypothetical protein
MNAICVDGHVAHALRPVQWNHSCALPWCTWCGHDNPISTLESSNWTLTRRLIPADIVRRKRCRTFRNLKDGEALARACQFAKDSLR